MREILADSRARLQRILHRRMDMRRAGLVSETLVDQRDGGVGKAAPRSGAASLDLFGHFPDGRQDGTILAGRKPVEIFVAQQFAALVELGQKHRASGSELGRM